MTTPKRKNVGDPYRAVEAELERALAAADPIIAAAATRRARLLLAVAATSQGFDPRRSRALGQALRDLAHGEVAASAPIAPLVTRGGGTR